MIKLKAREQTIKYAIAKKAKLLRKEEELERSINMLQREIESNETNEDKKMTNRKDLEDKMRELEKIIEYKTKGAILRAKCRWYNEGEKKYQIFFKS